MKLICLVSFWALIFNLTHAQNPEELWKRSFPEPDTSNVHIEKVVSDNEGNTYLTGDIFQNNDYDYITIKYSSSGIKLWSAIYNSPYDSTDKSTDIAVDASGNVYVTGISLRKDGHNDYLTIKYSLAGTIIWTERFNGTGPNEHNSLIKLALDVHKNVIVTGSNYGTPDQTWDFVTVKYNNNGALLWSVHYDSGGSGNYDVPFFITCDNKGNIIVTGEGLYKCTTVKYNAAGIEKWVAKELSVYINPSSGGMATDNSGNVYVTGSLGGQGGLVAIKYDSSGVIIWKKTYNACRLTSDIKVLNNGYLYLAGDSAGASRDAYCSTLKIGSASGTLVWLEKFNQRSYCRQLSVDAAGNAFVTADVYDSLNVNSSIATIKYNTEGRQEWYRIDQAPPGFSRNSGLVSLDGTGNPHVVLRHFQSTVQITQANNLKKENFSLIKLDISGNLQWYSRSGFDSFTDMSALVLDSRNNIYITGWTNQDKKNSDILTTKFDSSNTLLWSEIYNSPADSTDIPHDISIDREGNVYVAGVSEEGKATKSNYIIIKYDSTGTEKWTARYNGPDFGSDEAQKIIADADGNVYVTGNSLNSKGNYDIATIKFNKSGQFQWAEIYDGSDGGDDVANSLELDPQGNIYVGGTSDSIGALYDYLLIKYSPLGEKIWEKRYNGPANDGDHANAMIIDDGENAYITGWSVGYNTNTDFATVKYSPDGIRQWVERWDDPSGSFEGANAIAVDKQANVYVTGYSKSEGTRNDLTTVKYNSDGIQLWASQFDSDNPASDSGMFIVGDDNGSVYVLGESDNNLKLINYNTDGVFQSEIKAEPYELSKYIPSGISVSNKGNIYVAGTVKASNWSIWDIRKYRQPGFIPTTIRNNISLNSESVLLENFPNPFGSFTTVAYSLPVPGKITLILCNVLGIPIKTLVNEFQTQGEYKIVFSPGNNLPGGVYFVRLSLNGKLMETRKMILEK
jgi:uncharacterized delta-60 repeat protein